MKKQEQSGKEYFGGDSEEKAALDEFDLVLMVVHIYCINCICGAINVSSDASFALKSTGVFKSTNVAVAARGDRIEQTHGGD
jgi:hypothetical protein